MSTKDYRAFYALFQIFIFYIYNVSIELIIEACTHQQKNCSKYPNMSHSLDGTTSWFQSAKYGIKLFYFQKTMNEVLHKFAELDMSWPLPEMQRLSK